MPGLSSNRDAHKQQERTGLAINQYISAERLARLQKNTTQVCTQTYAGLGTGQTKPNTVSRDTQHHTR